MSSTINLAGQSIVGGMSTPYSKQQDTPKSASFHSKYYSCLKTTTSNCQLNSYGNTPTNFRQSESCENAFQRYHQSSQRIWGKDPQGQQLTLPLPIFNHQNHYSQRSLHNCNNSLQRPHRQLSPANTHKYKLRQFVDIKQFSKLQSGDDTTPLSFQNSDLSTTFNIPSSNINNSTQQQANLISMQQSNNLNNKTFQTSINLLDHCTPISQRLNTSVQSFNAENFKSNGGISSRDRLAMMSFASARDNPKPMGDSTNLLRQVFCSKELRPLTPISQQKSYKCESNLIKTSITKLNQSSNSLLQRLVDKKDFPKAMLEVEMNAKVAEIEEDKKIYAGLLNLSPLPKSREQGVDENKPNQDENNQGILLQLEQCQDKENTHTRKSVSSPVKSSIKARTKSNQTEVSRTFSKNYKNICHIVDEAKHFKDSMKVSEAMLTTTITQNILPRKLGIISKKQQIPQSESQGKSENTNNTTSLQVNSAIQTRRRWEDKDEEQTSFMKGIDQSFENELIGIKAFDPGNISIQSTRVLQSEQILQQNIPGMISFKSSRTILNLNNTNALSVNNNTSINLLDRSSSVMNRKSKIIGKYIGDDMHTNGLAEQYKLAFKDSEEVANYLQRNYLTKEEKKTTKLNLNLSRLHIAKTYSTMLSQALRHVDFKTLNYLNLSNNFLSGKALEELSRNLPEQLRKLNLSHNFLTSKDSQSLCYILDHKNYGVLSTVDLSHNLFADTGFKLIYQGIAKNTTLLSINLSHNKLTDQVGMLLNHVLVNNTSLQELYLGWNKFTSKTGIIIADGLNNNFNIKVLDLSHNSLGQNPSLSCGRKILQSCARIESGVIHLDFSYNLFAKAECLEIAQALSTNQKILGFHFEGNDLHAIVDSKGFLYFPDESQILQKHVATHTLMRRNIHSVKYLGVNKLQNFNCNATDNCWLCDGWQEIEFELKDNLNETFLGDPAFLHLDFEDFQPTYMDKDPNDPSRYFLRRMCPPNRRILFFFTNPMTEILFESMEYDRTQFHLHEQNLNFYEEDDDEARLDNEDNNDFADKSNNNILKNLDKSNSSMMILNNDAGSLPNQQNQVIHNLQRTKQRKFNVKYLDGTVQEYIVPTTVNFIATKAHKNIHKKKGEYDIHIQSLPRPTETYFKINFTNQWHRPISLFKSYQADTPEVELRCFEEDWNNSKAQQIIQNNYKNPDIEACKKLLLEKFPKLRVVYRYLSCFGLINDYFFVTLHPFTLFATQSKIVDGNLLKMRDLECIFIAASSKALKVRSLRMPDKALTRPEFLEAVARLAVDKYIRNKCAKSPAEAVQMFLDNPYFQTHINDYEDPQLWRDIRYWTKQCDGVLKKYLNFIKSVWNEYADSRKVEKKLTHLNNIKTMSLKEFCDISNEFELRDKLLGDREVNISFNLALMTIPDETASEKYMVMSFVEFLEGLARMAEFKSRTPVGEREEAYVSYEREQIRLEYKLESLLEAMSLKYDTVMKNKKKDKLFQNNQRNSKQKSGQRLQALTSRKSFIQFSVPDAQKTGSTDQNDNSNVKEFGSNNNKLVGAVNKVLSEISKNSKQNGNDYSDRKNIGNAVGNSIYGIQDKSSHDLSKAPSRFLDRIDSLNDELEEDNSFYQKQQPSGIVSLNELDDRVN